MKVYNESLNEKMGEGIASKLLEIRKKRNFTASEYVENKANTLNSYMSKFGLKACVVAVSGGIDSAIVLGIVNYASKKENSPIEKIVPLLLPISKSKGVTNQDKATERGLELCEKLNISPNIIDLSDVNKNIDDNLKRCLNISSDAWAIGQLGPYSRTPVLYYTTSLLSQEGYPAIVCGTTNKDEGSYLGYIGKASDGMVDVQLISDIHKSEVYSVGRFLDIPNSIMTVTPSGDMYDNRTDEMVFGASYDFVELYLNFLNWSNQKKILFLESLSTKDKDQFMFYASNLENMHKYNLHKYMACSPAIHLDLWDSSVKDGWEGYFAKFQKIMGEE